MGDEPDSPVSVYLRRIDAKVDGIAGELRDVKARLGLIEVGMSGVRREIAFLSGSYATLSVRMDHFDERMARIERRLDLLPV